MRRYVQIPLTLHMIDSYGFLCFLHVQDILADLGVTAGQLRYRHHEVVAFGVIVTAFEVLDR